MSYSNCGLGVEGGSFPQRNFRGNHSTYENLRDVGLQTTVHVLILPSQQSAISIASLRKLHTAIVTVAK